MRTRHLHLIKHSMPELRAEVPPAAWHLGPEGIRRAEALAAAFRPAHASVVFTSLEPKAMETAAVLGGCWELPVQKVEALHEHERPEPGLMAREAFEARMRELFGRPSDQVFGAESAERARRRFTQALVRLLARQTDDVVVVTHGTVLTLFVAQATGVEPFMFWRKLELPCIVTLQLPDLRLEGVTSWDQAGAKLRM